MADHDARYLSLVLNPIRKCASYKPKFGLGKNAPVSLAEFQTLFQSDPFYSWFGLDNALMYAAHKAAGGMTSIYRQIGIGCEKLFRTVIQDSFQLSATDVKWSYKLPPDKDGKVRVLALDARIPFDSIADDGTRARIKTWMVESASALNVDVAIVESLKGIVFEVRQGYKSKDSKRQNADIDNATYAYTSAYLPCAVILSAQIDADILDRYRKRQWTILTGSIGLNNPHVSTYDFTRDVIGYDLAAFFTRNAASLRTELDHVLRTLLTPDS